MLEKIMLKELRNKLTNFPVEITNIETGSVSVGVPDWYVRTQWRSVWIEAKEIKRMPVKSSTTIKIDFRAGQWPWILKHKRLGETVLLACTFKDTWFLLNDIRKEYSVSELSNLSLFPPMTFTKSKYYVRDYELMNILNGS